MKNLRQKETNNEMVLLLFTIDATKKKENVNLRLTRVWL